MVPKLKFGSNGWNAVELLPAASSSVSEKSPSRIDQSSGEGVPGSRLRGPIASMQSAGDVFMQQVPLLVGDVLDHPPLDDDGADSFYVFGLEGKGFLK